MRAFWINPTNVYSSRHLPIAILCLNLNHSGSLAFLNYAPNDGPTIGNLPDWLTIGNTGAKSNRFSFVEDIARATDTDSWAVSLLTCGWCLKGSG
jgi:hypothetical protein